MGILARGVVAFFVIIGATSFVVPTTDLLHPFAPSPAGSALPTVHLTSSFSFTPSLDVVMGQCKQEGERRFSWLTLTVIQHSCSIATEKTEWSLG